jgi:hypothetical protein
MKIFSFLVLFSTSNICFSQDLNSFKPYRIDFEAGYYNAQKFNADGYDSSFNYGVANGQQLITFKVAYGMGKRLGPVRQFESLGEFIIEEILVPIRYGIFAAQYGYKIDLKPRLTVEGYAGAGLIAANDNAYLVIPVTTKLMYLLGKHLDLGIAGNYNFNSLNNFQSMNAVVGYRF